MDKQAVLDRLDADLILDLTAKLIAIPTVNPPGQEVACARFIHDTLTGWGVECALVHEPDPARPQVVAFVRGRGEGPTFILNAHMDTVPADAARWTRPVFEATREGDLLYGLGSCDMKGSLASIMAMLKALNDSAAQLPGTLMAQFQMGEETDEPGTKTLLALGYVGDMAITMEPTGGRIGPGTRGACWYKMEIEGPSAHCGLSAADAPDVMHVAQRVMAEIEALHDEVVGQVHHLLDSPAARVTQCIAGETHNSRARRAELLVDRRMLPHESVEAVGEDLHARLDRAIGGRAGVTGTVSFVDLNEATETPLDSDLVQTLSANIRDLSGTEPEIWGPPYGSDMRNFVVDRGIPCVNFGAGDFRRCHQPDECVPVSDLLAVARITFGTVLDVISRPQP